METALLFRVDASPEMGTGHVMRCLALAQAARRLGFTPSFLTTQGTRFLHPALERQHVPVSVIDASCEPGSARDADVTATEALRLGARWVVCDGYHFREAFQEAIRTRNLRLLFVDDYGHCSRYCADLVLNQNVYADPARYVARCTTTRLLLGLRYALLRDEFSPYVGREKPFQEPVRRVLVTFGGSDPAGKTIPCLELIDSLPARFSFSIDIVVGSGNRQFDEIERVAKRLSRPATVHCNVPSIAPLMESADLAFTAAGSTVWELLFMGVPTIATVVAENQKPIANALESLGLALCIGLDGSPAEKERVVTLWSDAEIRRSRLEDGRARIDGRGACRVASEFDTLRFRRMESDDCIWVWEAANESLVRAVSFSSDPIPWADHCAWFDRRITDPRTLFLAVENIAGKRVGHVRFDPGSEDGDSVISITILADFRGLGYGARLLEGGHRTLRRDFPRIRRIHAFIKPSNRASLDLFRKAGYRECHDGSPEKLHYVLTFEAELPEKSNS